MDYNRGCKRPDNGGLSTPKAVTVKLLVLKLWILNFHLMCRLQYFTRTMNIITKIIHLHRSFYRFNVEAIVKILWVILGVIYTLFSTRIIYGH